MREYLPGVFAVKFLILWNDRFLICISTIRICAFCLSILRIACICRTVCIFRSTSIFCITYVCCAVCLGLRHGLQAVCQRCICHKSIHIIKEENICDAVVRHQPIHIVIVITGIYDNNTAEVWLEKRDKAVCVRVFKNQEIFVFFYRRGDVDPAVVSSKEDLILIFLLQSTALVHGSSFFALFHIVYYIFGAYILGNIDVNGVPRSVISAFG